MRRCYVLALLALFLFSGASAYAGNVIDPYRYSTSGGSTTITGITYTVTDPYSGYSANPAEAALRDGIYNTDTNAATDTGSAGTQTIVADFGSAISVAKINYACLSVAAPGTWGCDYIENAPFEYSANCSTGWTSIGTAGAVLSEDTIYTFNVSITARCIRVSNTSAGGWLAMGDFWFQN